MSAEVQAARDFLVEFARQSKMPLMQVIYLFGAEVFGGIGCPFEAKTNVPANEVGLLAVATVRSALVDQLKERQIESGHIFRLMLENPTSTTSQGRYHADSGRFAVWTLFGTGTIGVEGDIESNCITRLDRDTQTALAERRGTLHSARTGDITLTSTTIIHRAGDRSPELGPRVVAINNIID